MSKNWRLPFNRGTRIWSNKELLIILAILVFPTGGFANITFDGNGKWSTTFDYSKECSQRNNLGDVDCASVADDGVQWSWGSHMIYGHATQAATDANNPDGEGGLGFRAWVGDGSNSYTGTVRVDFPSPQLELWIRWYQRYQLEFAWAGGSPYYDKTLYIRTIGDNAVIPEPASSCGTGGNYGIITQDSPDPCQSVADPPYTWHDIFGQTSDGLWHLFEIHIKMDTDSSDGVGQMWIDGNLVINDTDIDYSGGDSDVRQGWRWFDWHNNQDNPANGGAAYVDYDDMAIYNQTPPDTDGNGYHWIGPLGSVPKTIYYLDADGDGYSDGTSQEAESDPGLAWYLVGELLAISGDCDDEDPTVNPGSSDPCKDCDVQTPCGSSESNVLLFVPSHLIHRKR